MFTLRAAAARAALLSLPLLAFTAAPTQAQRPEEGTLKVGDPSPAVTLPELQGPGSVSLSGLKGKPVALLFGSCT